MWANPSPNAGEGKLAPIFVAMAPARRGTRRALPGAAADPKDAPEFWWLVEYLLGLPIKDDIDYVCSMLLKDIGEEEGYPAPIKARLWLRFLRRWLHDVGPFPHDEGLGSKRSETDACEWDWETPCVTLADLEELLATDEVGDDFFCSKRDARNALQVPKKLRRLCKSRAMESSVEAAEEAFYLFGEYVDRAERGIGPCFLKFIADAAELCHASGTDIQTAIQGIVDRGEVKEKDASDADWEDAHHITKASVKREGGAKPKKREPPSRPNRKQRGKKPRRDPTASTGNTELHDPELNRVNQDLQKSLKNLQAMGGDDPIYDACKVAEKASMILQGLSRHSEPEEGAPKKSPARKLARNLPNIAPAEVSDDDFEDDDEAEVDEIFDYARKDSKASTSKKKVAPRRFNAVQDNAQALAWSKSDDEGDDGDAGEVHGSTERPIVGNRREKKKWSAEEEEKLIEITKRMGRGKWKAILMEGKEFFAKNKRTTVDLKDKWRNIEKKYSID